MALLFALSVLVVSVTQAVSELVQQQAETPPRGWNSYDSYTWKVSEEDFLANCAAMAKNLKSAGYEYCIVDYLWFQDLDQEDRVAGISMDAPKLRDPITKIHIDQNGRLLPAPDRWPSAWAKNGTALGFKPTAEKVHAMGMKFGIHIMRGISVAAVAAKAPVLGGGGATADAIALPSELCPWWKGVMSVNASHPAGQAFFDSITQQYADWGVDFLKNDCVFGNQFVPDQIAAQSQAIKNIGRSIIYSLSPGSTPKGQSGAEVALARQVATDVNMYRVTGDDWDKWSDVSSHFAVANHMAEAGLIGASGLGGSSWPDMDMLPLGVVTSPGSGRLPYKNSSLSHPEQFTQMTLWAIAKSPLMFGGDATQLDDFTLSLLGNSEVLEMNAHSVANKQVSASNTTVIWMAKSPQGQTYAALFNLEGDTKTIQVKLSDLGLPAGIVACSGTDLWTGKPFRTQQAGTMRMSVDPHGVTLVSLSKCSDERLLV